MSRIFLSHSSIDNFSAVALDQWLMEEGWDDAFLDLDPAQGIHPGQRWERALYDHASDCDAVLSLVSRNWLGSDWCRREHDLARKLNKRVFVVNIDDLKTDDLPAYLKETHHAVTLGAGENHRVFNVTLNGLMETTISAAIVSAQGHGISDRTRTCARASTQTKA